MKKHFYLKHYDVLPYLVGTLSLTVVFYPYLDKTLNMNIKYFLPFRFKYRSSFQALVAIKTQCFTSVFKGQRGKKCKRQTQI